MGYLANEILDVSSKLGYYTELLSPSDTQKVFSAILEKFCHSNKSKPLPLWELLENSIGIHNSEAWSWISEFVGKKPILIFFEQSDDSSIVYLKNGSFLSEILGECFGFVFYITDLKYSYIISFNDHDILIGSGTAANWIKSKSL